MSDIILSGRGVSKSFRGLDAIRDVDCDIRRGSITGLIGPNGAGKSTLFNLVTGYGAPTRGVIRFNGQDLAAVPTFQRNQLGIARAFQISRPFANLSVAENIRVGALFGRAAPRNPDAVVAEALRMTGLTALARRPAQGLTAGNLRKLELARAYATRPELLLADEPCAGLNPVETDAMLECLRQMRETGVTVWLVEHDMKAVTRLCDTLIVLEAGQKIAEGAPQDIIHNCAVVAAYLGRADGLLQDKS